MTTPPPSSTFEVDIDEEQVAFFHEHGYLAIDRITTDDEVAWLRAIFDEVFRTRQGGVPGAFFDTARPYDEDGDDLFTQALLPEIRFPELRATQFVRNGRRIASRLLGRREADLQHWGHMLSKTAASGPRPVGTRTRRTGIRSSTTTVGDSMPLDDATADNGCLWFVPGSHRNGTLRHRHLNDDPAVHILELVEPWDASDAVAVPTAAGEASFHHPRTLHYRGRTRPTRPARVRRRVPDRAGSPRRPGRPAVDRRRSQGLQKARSVFRGS